MSSHPRPSTDQSLIERDREQRLLTDATRSAWAGDGRVVIVQGAAGIGKSALISSVRDELRSDETTLLSARCSALESTYAFGVVRQLFEVPLRRCPQWLDGPATSCRAAFEVPREPVDPEGFDDVSYSVLHGLYWLVVNATADGPLTVVVDDIQWCDGPSLRFLTYLAGRLAGLPVMVLASARSGEPAEAEPLLAELAHEEATDVLHLQPLSSAGVADFLRARLGAPPGAEFAAACARATRGNPLLLDELSRAMREDGIRPETASASIVGELGPRAVGRAVLLRLARLDAEAVATAQAVAVLGDAADLEVLRRMTGLTADVLQRATRALAQAQILGTGGLAGFVHPLIRDSVYYELSPVERQARHEQAARVLLDLGRSSEAVAAHALLLPPAGQRWLVEVLLDAARVAISRGAPEIAVASLRRALAEPPPDDLHGEVVRHLGLGEALANDPAQAAIHLTAAYDSAPDPRTRAYIAEVLARMLFFSRPPGEAVAVSRRAMTDLPQDMPDHRDAFTALDLYAISFGAADDGEALAAANRGVRGDGTGSKMLMAVRAWDGAVTGGSARECLSQARSAIAGDVLVRKDPSFMVHIAAGVLTLADDPGAVELWDRAMAEGHSHGSQMAIGGVLLWQGWGWLQRGALGEAEDRLRGYLTATRRRGGETEQGFAYGLGFLLRTLVLRGELGEAGDLAAEPRLAPPGSDGDIQQVRGQVELHLARSSWTAALAALDSVPSRRRPVTNPAWAPWGALAAPALTALGRHEDAVARASADLRAAHAWGSPTALGLSLRATGLALDGAGDDSAVSVLQQAVAATEGQPPLFEHATSLVALGRVLRHARQPAAARPHLERAAELARACGGGPLEELATAELRAAGGVRARHRGAGADALTPSERRVAVLAAGGRTNKDIAQVLFVTPKTVEVHLSNTYRKLGVTSRAGLHGRVLPET